LLISDPSVAAIRISGTFKALNVEAFVRLLKEAYVSRWNRRDGS